jgi:aspartokinase/homoserine dehydrogenase 1
VSIVTPNKVANSSKTKFYEGLREAANCGKSEFRYETNVGAALPIIDSLKDLMQNGDKIIKIEGVFSGTLSYIFNLLKEGKKFSDIVRNAKENGYTEPDPRDDLSGLDIARKLLILIRETGTKIELDDIKVENLVPKKLQNIKNIDEFLNKLKEYDSKFEAMRIEAEKENKVLAYVAKYENKKATVKMESVSIDHPCGSLSGTENVVVFNSRYYNDVPLTIKGPGAGPIITASGVLSDILKIANSKG